MNEINKAIEILKKNKIIEALEFYNNRISISHVPAIQSIQGIESFKYDNIFGSTSFKYYEKNIQFSYIRHGGEIYQNDGGVFNLRRYGLLELIWDNETVLEIETSYRPFTINTNPDDADERYQIAPEEKPPFHEQMLQLQIKKQEKESPTP